MFVQPSPGLVSLAHLWVFHPKLNRTCFYWFGLFSAIYSTSKSKNTATESFPCHYLAYEQSMTFSPSHQVRCCIYICVYFTHRTCYSLLTNVFVQIKHRKLASSHASGTNSYPILYDHVLLVDIKLAITCSNQCKLNNTGLVLVYTLYF